MAIWDIPRNTLLSYFLVILATFGIGFWTGNRQSTMPSELTKNGDIIDLSSVSKPIKVYICGDVKNPGVYDMTTGDCVLNAVEKAGGFGVNADRRTVNLARTLKGGEQITIQTLLPLDAETLPSLQSTTKQQSTSNKASSLININTATKEILMNLPGIGEVKALAIIAYRDKNGWFSEVNELDQVSGIGPKTLESLLPLITTN